MADTIVERGDKLAAKEKGGGRGCDGVGKDGGVYG